MRDKLKEGKRLTPITKPILGQKCQEGRHEMCFVRNCLCPCGHVTK